MPDMKVNAAFDQPVFTKTRDLDWQPSPMKGVERRMLDRIGDEVARATSIVRYAKGSAFSEHTHSGGEEFIVLEGVFQDEHGDYPAGTYVRNPIGTHHIPRSDDGCIIFVKLWQFADDDHEQLAINLNTLRTEAEPDRSAVRSAILARRDYEQVSMEEWAEGADHSIGHDGGVELLILSGGVTHDGDIYGAHDWIRLPPSHSIQLMAGSEGARLWIKRGHLGSIRIPSK